jgi:hypothetical protein
MEELVLLFLVRSGWFEFSLAYHASAGTAAREWQARGIPGV